MRSLGPSWMAVSCLVLTACAEGVGPVVPTPPRSPDAFDMSGTWTLTVNAVDPPVVFACDGDLAGRSFSFCDSFEVTVVQNDVNFLPAPGGDPSGPFCESTFEMTGTATVREISGMIGRARTVSATPPVVEQQNLEFQAGVLGNSGTFALVRLTIRGTGGECALGGSYRGERAASN